MAPKPSVSKPTAAGKKPTGALSAKGKAAEAVKSDGAASGDDSPTTMAAPKNKEEVLAQVNLDGLPNCPADAIIEILRGKYEALVAIFIHYCKHSECKTMEMSTRLRLGERPASERIAPQRTRAPSSCRPLHLFSLGFLPAHPPSLFSAWAHTTRARGLSPRAFRGGCTAFARRGR